MKVVAVPSRGEIECSSLADKVLNSLLEFQPEFWGLPPFEDCMNLFIFLVLILLIVLNFIITVSSFLHDNSGVDRALPIDPIYLSSQYVNGSMNEISGV